MSHNEDDSSDGSQNEDEEAELLERKRGLQLGEREIVPADLEMWAKTADKKFAVAWEEYKKMDMINRDQSLSPHASGKEKRYLH